MHTYSLDSLGSHQGQGGREATRKGESQSIRRRRKPGLQLSVDAAAAAISWLRG
jgi:hypothetical protein